MICFNNKLYVDIWNRWSHDENSFRLVHKNLKDSKIGRGVNVVVADGETYEIKSIDTYDTYSEGMEKRFEIESMRFFFFFRKFSYTSFKTQYS